jgi:Tfp pilus assembly protein PilF
MAVCFEQTKQLPRALDVLDQALKKDPQNKEVQKKIASLRKAIDMMR